MQNAKKDDSVQHLKRVVLKIGSLTFKQKYHWIEDKWLKLEYCQNVQYAYFHAYSPQAVSKQKSQQADLVVSFGWSQIRNVLKNVYKDVQSPVEKRLAAYLILMKNPDFALVKDIVSSFDHMGDVELMTFVASHMKHIRNSNEPEMQQWVIAQR